MRFFLNNPDRGLGEKILSPSGRSNDPLFSDEFIDWARVQSHPVVFYTATSVNSAKGKQEFIINVCDAVYHHYTKGLWSEDSIIIEDPDTILLFKLTWI